MSCKSSPTTSIVNFLISFILAFSITNSFHILATGGWSGLSNLLVGYPIYAIVFITIMAFLFSLFCNIINYVVHNENSQKIDVPRDMILSKKNKTPSKIDSVSNDRDLSIGKMLKNSLSFTLNILIGIFLIFLTIFFLITMSVDRSISKNYEKSLHTQYKINDYNDSTIIFYNKELDKATFSFMNASTKYDIFKSFSKRKMALECIKISLEEYNRSNAYKATKNFQLNARNRYADNKKMTHQNRQNEKIFLRYFTSRTTTINQPIQNMLREEKADLCENKLSVNNIYELFIPKYIDSVTKEIEIKQENIILSNNPEYTKRKINNLISWLNKLYEQYPQYQKKTYKKDKYNAYRQYSRFGYDDSL